MTESVPYVTTLLPIIAKAASNVGFKGTIGTGLTVLGLLSNSEVFREATRLLIQKTSEILNPKIAEAERRMAFRKAFQDANEFDDAQAEINFKPMKTVLRGAKRRSDDWHRPAKRTRRL